VDDEAITADALAARDGDRTAAAAFVRATTPGLRRLLGYLADAGHVDDLLQETYLRAFAALPGYACRAPARAWLLGIARRVAADHVRAAQRRPRAAGADVHAVLDRRRASPGPAGWVGLAHAVRALSPEKREAFALTSLLGLSYAEAAEVCGCPVGTIRSRVYRARADLLDALADGARPESTSNAERMRA
jgi:RNA polymerase sigma-70 factor (ECF subfamily)